MWSVRPVLADDGDGEFGWRSLDGEEFSFLCTLSHLPMTSLVMPHLLWRFLVLPLRDLLDSAIPSWIERVSTRLMVRLIRREFSLSTSGCR